MDDDLIYWNGVAVGCYIGCCLVWFVNAPREAIDYHTRPELVADRS